MNRSKRATIAKQTVAICDEGFYQAPSGARVSVSQALAKAKAGTVLYSPVKLPTSCVADCGAVSTCINVNNETTFQALARLANESDGHLACLNFASAKNPGGGFLNGSLAQEEALACASGLYPCLLTARDYYTSNRENTSLLYLDLAVFSPLVPFFRDDEGVLLERPILASVITAPAPNAGAVAQNEPHNMAHVEPTLGRRAELVLSIASAHGVNRIVLGAWGCGVFRNDPKLVAAAFADLLKPTGKFAGVFKDVAFAVYDRSESLATYKAFFEQFSGR